MVTQRPKPRMRQVVDWRAAMIAGLVAGTAFLLIILFILPSWVGGNMWIMARMLGSLVLGSDVLAPPATSHLPALVAGAVAHLAISMGVTALIAIVIHRYGMLVGVLGGALLGLAFYAIHMYTVTYFFPWFYVLEGAPFMMAHLLFGGLAGGVYEAFEVERFEEIQEAGS